MAARGKENGKYQGMRWISHHKRLSIYLRDGLACCYCGRGLEDDVRLTLDHLVPYSASGRPDNSAGNLVTVCLHCNSSRGDRDWKKFAVAVASYVNHNVKPSDIIAHIETTIQRELDVKEAKGIIERRGGFSKALAGLRK